MIQQNLFFYKYSLSPGRHEDSDAIDFTSRPPVSGCFGYWSVNTYLAYSCHTPYNCLLPTRALALSPPQSPDQGHMNVTKQVT